MPIETVSKILGHSKITTTQIFSYVMDHKIRSDMDAVQESLNKKARQLEEEKELVLLQEKIFAAEEKNNPHMTKEELLMKLKKILSDEIAYN